MNLDDFIIICFCLIDNLLPQVLQGKRLRRRGPMPKVTDSEVLTMEVVGSYLELNKETHLIAYFRRHDLHFFLALQQVHRTTLTRQMANLWAVKERLWMLLRDQLIVADEQTAIVDSCGIPVCRFERATRCKIFRGQARCGWNPVQKQHFYGFRLHARITWQGLITQMDLAPANEHEGTIVEELVEGTSGLLLGDRNYWLPEVQQRLWEQGIPLQAPFKKPHSPKAKA